MESVSSGVSIHTSAREVTFQMLSFCVPVLVSIHTSAREVTRTPRRHTAEIRVSIHTSAREVTRNDTVRLFKSTKFQSTLPQGKWHMPLYQVVINGLFQSTLPQGKWLRIRFFESCKCSFNPHFRKGSDSLPIPGLRDIRVSIHTSAREVTALHQRHHAAS